MKFWKAAGYVLIIIGVIAAYALLHGVIELVVGVIGLLCLPVLAWNSTGRFKWFCLGFIFAVAWIKFPTWQTGLAGTVALIVLVKRDERVRERMADTIASEHAVAVRPSLDPDTRVQFAVRKLTEQL